MKTSEEKIKQAITEGLEAAKWRAVPDLDIIPDTGRKIKVGQVFQTLTQPIFPKNLEDDCCNEDPFLVIVVQTDHPRRWFRRPITVAPILPEACLASDACLIFPATLLGFEAAVAVGASVGMMPQNLGTCRGRLPEEAICQITGFRDYLQGSREEKPKGVVTGLELFGDQSTRYEYHSNLLGQLDYLQYPYLRWLNL